MIFIKNLNNENTGQFVMYKSKLETGTMLGTMLGRIKSWNEQTVFVVYQCNDKWNNYKDYTACATNPNDLTLVKR